jgi:ribose transport system permease protein
MEAHDGIGPIAPVRGGALGAWREAERRYPNLRPTLGVWIVFCLVFALGAALGWVGGFGQVHTALVLAAFAVVVSYGQNIVVLTGGIDLSVPFTITATSILLTSLTDDVAPALTVLIALGFAGVVGLWNGIGVAYLKISPLIMTLAANIVLLGLTLAYTSGTPSGLAPRFLVTFMTGSLLGVENVLLIGLAVVVLGSLVLLNTSFGRYVFAIGNSPEVAYLSGIPVRRVTLTVYVVAALCYGLAGVMLSGWNEQASFQMGDAYLFPSIAAVVLGGTSILGGRGNFVGTAGGAALFTAIGTVLAGTTLPQSTRNVVIGVVLVVAVAIIQRERVTR